MTVVQCSLREMIAKIGPCQTREASIVPKEVTADEYARSLRVKADKQRNTGLGPLEKSDVECAIAYVIDIMRAEGNLPVVRQFIGTRGYVVALEGKPSPLIEGEADYKGTAASFRDYMAVSSSREFLESVIHIHKRKLDAVFLRSLY